MSVQPAAGAPTDADFDDMHHALGRPDGPHVEPYRNFYSCDAGGITARRFEALGLWSLDGYMNGGDLAVYRVNTEGRRLLMAHLVTRQKEAGVRPWIVTGQGISTRTIVAKSASAARYDVFLTITDTFSMSFREFLKLRPTARLA